MRANLLLPSSRFAENITHKNASLPELPHGLCNLLYAAYFMPAINDEDLFLVTSLQLAVDNESPRLRGLSDYIMLFRFARRQWAHMGATTASHHAWP